MKNNDINALKKLTKSFYNEKEKETINFYNEKKDTFNMGVVYNYIPSEKVYEVFCFIEDNNDIASGLHNKLFKHKLFSTFYFNYLKNKIEDKDIKFFFKD